MTKKVVGFILFFILSAVGLLAQLSSKDFYVDQQNSGYVDNYPTWESFVNATNIRVEEQKQNMIKMGLKANVGWVIEPTRMENELVNKAYQELPDTTRIGSTFVFIIRSSFSTSLYSVYIYSDPDGERYYRLLRLVALN